MAGLFSGGGLAGMSTMGKIGLGAKALGAMSGGGNAPEGETEEERRARELREQMMANGPAQTEDVGYRQDEPPGIGEIGRASSKPIGIGGRY